MEEERSVEGRAVLERSVRTLAPAGNTPCVRIAGGRLVQCDADGRTARSGCEG